MKFKTCNRCSRKIRENSRLLYWDQDMERICKPCYDAASPPRRARKKKAKAKWTYTDNCYFRNGKIVCEYDRFRVLAQLIKMDNQISNLRNKGK